MGSKLSEIAENFEWDYNEAPHTVPGTVTIEVVPDGLAVRWAKWASTEDRLQLDIDMRRTLGIKPRRGLTAAPAPKSRRRKKQTTRRMTTPPPGGGRAA